VQLQQAWYEHIPLSEKMGVRIQQYTGQKFITTMPETGNQNPHHTLFAGVYSRWRRSPVGGLSG